jgi:hypothetical protein
MQPFNPADPTRQVLEEDAFWGQVEAVTEPAEFEWSAGVPELSADVPTAAEKEFAAAWEKAVDGFGTEAIESADEPIAVEDAS